MKSTEVFAIAGKHIKQGAKGRISHKQLEITLPTKKRNENRQPEQSLTDVIKTL